MLEMREFVLLWKMRCHNTEPPLGEHQIEIPSPKHLELRTGQWQLERDDLQTLFACPQCGRVYPYKGSEALCWQKFLEVGQDIPPDAHPLCIALPCVVEGCRPRTEIRTTRYANETNEQVLDRLGRADFRNVTCSKGHALSFPHDGVAAFEGAGARPF